MRVLFVHNYYQKSGGEDSVFFNEMSLLKDNGHIVDSYTRSNSEIDSFLKKSFSTLSLFYSRKAYKEVSRKILAFKPDVVHVHNFFPLISPAVFFACRKHKVPVALTLHNYRLICPSSFLMFNDKIVTKSLKGNPFWSVRKRVYKGSVIGTFFLSLFIYTYRKLNLWNKIVDQFICLTEFSKRLFIGFGINESLISVKPNFVNHSDGKSPTELEFDFEGEFALYVGRLDREKGIDFLLSNWTNDIGKLVVVGDGDFSSLIENHDSIIYLGKQDKDSVLWLMSKARFLIMCSTWYEGLPMVLVEAFSKGTCALVPNLGGMAEVVENRFSGLQYESGNSDSFRSLATELMRNDNLIAELSKNCKTDYEIKYSSHVNYNRIISIYGSMIEKANES